MRGGEREGRCQRLIKTAYLNLDSRNDEILSKLFSYVLAHCMYSRPCTISFLKDIPSLRVVTKY